MARCPTRGCGSRPACTLPTPSRGCWREHHLFLPALLFLTTTPTRASRFLKALERALLGSARRYGTRSRTPLVAAAGALAFTPGWLLDEACLADLDGREGLRLLDVLNVARAPYEQALAYRREQQEAEEEERQRLREDPEAMREHLRRYEHSLDSYIKTLGPTGAQTLKLMLASDAQPLSDERAVLRAIARDLGDTLLEPGMSALPAPGATVESDVTLLADYYRDAQQKQLGALVSRYGDGPRLREAHEHLRSGGLIEHHALGRLPVEAEGDAAGREEQRERRLAYLAWRERTARQLARKAGPLGRLTHRTEDFYPQVDRRWLGSAAAARRSPTRPLRRPAAATSGRPATTATALNWSRRPTRTPRPARKGRHTHE